MVDYLSVAIQNPWWVLGFVVLALALSYIREARGKGFSIPFGIITASLLLLIYSLLPDPISEWAPYSEVVQPIDAVSMALLAAIVSAGIWVVVYTLHRESTPKPETVADHVFKKFGQVVDSYARILGLFAMFLVFFVYAFMGNFAEVLGQIGNVIAMEPFVASNILTALAGFAALGGELPIIGSLPVLRSLSPIGWLTLVTLLILGAAMAAYDARGQTSRLFR